MEGSNIIKTYLVELNFIVAPTALTSVNFIDQPQLRNKRIIGIEAISASQLVVSPTGKTMATQANCLNTGLTLKQGTTEVIYQNPFSQFITQNNGGTVKKFFGIVINFQKSTIDIFAAAIAANESICYNFWYVDAERWNEYLQLKQKYGELF